MNKLKTIVAVLAITGMVGYSVPAGAVTIEELMAQIAELQAQLVALQAQTGATATACTFTRSLYLGVSGTDVKCLQQYLNAAGYTVAASGAGSAGNETEYYGSLTQAAVAAWQAANGVTPAAGYFGPISQAKYDSLVAAGEEEEEEEEEEEGAEEEEEEEEEEEITEGEEGTLTAKLYPTPVGAEVRAGDDNIEVAGFELEAKESGIRVERMDIEFTGAGTEVRPWKYFDRASLSVGGSVVATKAITGSSDFTEASNVYTLRFSGMNEVIPVNEKQVWTLQVSAEDVIDSGNTGAVQGAWSVKIPANGVRGVDGAGINQIQSAATTARTFTVQGEDTAVLTVTVNSGNLAERAVQVDADDMTDDVELLAFDIKATKRAVTIEDIDVVFTATPNAATVDNVAPIAKLYQGTEVKGTATVEAGGTVAFTDMEIEIAKDATATLLVKTNLNRLAAGTTYDEGQAIKAALGGTAAITGEDSGENSVTATSSIAGNYAYLYTDVPSWALVSASASQVVLETDREASVEIVVDITALGGDIYIRNTNGVLGAATGDVTGAVLTQSMTAASITETDGTNGHLVQENTTRRFTVSGNIATADTTGGFAGMKISQIVWNTDGSTSWTTSTFGLTNFKTNTVLIKAGS